MSYKDNTSEGRSRAVVIVTGANTGVGLGFCERLLHQFINGHTSATFPNAPTDFPGNSYISCSKLTLLLACRNLGRAQRAKSRLLEYVGNQVQSRTGSSWERATSFRDSLEINILEVDLMRLDTVFQLGKELRDRYQYVSHLFCNAGYAHYELDSLKYLKSMMFDTSMTNMDFTTEYVGELSEDGLGLIWQTNLFAHFVLYMVIRPLLLASPAQIMGRVIWTTSLVAAPLFQWNDLQLVQTERPYESVKCQIELIGNLLDAECKEREEPIRHFVSSPGVVSSGLGRPDANPAEAYVKLFIFYVILRIIAGNFRMAITPFRGSLAAIHLSTISTEAMAKYPSTGIASVLESRCTRLGKEQLVSYEVDVEAWEEPRKLLQYCHGLFQKIQATKDSK
jgi:3-keto steroid reductase